jgi:hypothetical protein
VKKITGKELFIKLINNTSYILTLNSALFVSILYILYYTESHYTYGERVKKIERNLETSLQILKSINQRLAQQHDDNIIIKILNEGYKFPLHLTGLYYVNQNNTYSIWGKTHNILTPENKNILLTLPQDGIKGITINGKGAFALGKVEGNKPHYLLALIDELANKELYGAEILIPNAGMNGSKNKDKIIHELKKYNAIIMLDRTTLVNYVLSNKLKIFFIYMNVLLLQIFIKLAYLHKLAKDENTSLGTERGRINILRKYFEASRLKPYFLRELTDSYQNKMIAQLIKIAKDVDDQQDLETIKLKLIHFTTTVQSTCEGISLIEEEKEVNLWEEVKLSLDMLLNKISENDVFIKYNGLGSTIKTKQLLFRIFLYNLFDEIIESLPPKGTITIEAATSPEETLLSITDNGYVFDSAKLIQEKGSGSYEGLILTPEGRDKVAKLLNVQVEKCINETTKNQTKVIFQHSVYNSLFEDVQQDVNPHLIYKH